MGVWLGTLLALYLAFIFQLETPQWAGVSVWIMFMQRPRLNYSKVMFWIGGTLCGAVMATFLTIAFNQMPEILLFSLSLWLATCAAVATQLREYRAYGAVLAGYTAAIIAFTAIADPDQIFEIAITRVSCVALGVSCAALAMTIFLPLHRHWPQTLHHLNEYFRAILHQTNLILLRRGNREKPVSWFHVVERLSTVEHTFDFTLAESVDSRARADQARSLTAALFNLAGKAQSVEFHLEHSSGSHSEDVVTIQKKTGDLIEEISSHVSESSGEALIQQIADLRAEIERRKLWSAGEMERQIADRFLLDQCEGMLRDVEQALLDLRGLYAPWEASRAVRLTRHQDRALGGLYALRIFIAMGIGSAFWFATQWPSGSTFLLFLAVVCSLLSLLDHAENLGIAFLKSISVCFITSFFVLFWVLQPGEGFLYLAVGLGLFLVPAAYAYTHPKFAGSAVISMLIFFGLVSPSNVMNYDIELFMNNGLAFLAAASFGFFSFHAVRSPSPSRRRGMLLRALNRDLKRSGLGDFSETAWTSLTFDRLRLLHRFGGNQGSSDLAVQEGMMHLGLLWGLGQITLRRLIERSSCRSLESLIENFLKRSGRPFHHASALTREVGDTLAACSSMGELADREAGGALIGALAHLREMKELLASIGGEVA